MLKKRRHQLIWLNDALSNKIATHQTAKLVSLGINHVRYFHFLTKKYSF